MSSSEPLKEEKKNRVPTASAILSDGRLAEMVFDTVAERTQFVVGNGETWAFEKTLPLNANEELVPYSPTNNLLKHGVVLLPREPEEYGSEEELVAAIRSFIHEYVDLEEDFEDIATYYVLFTWLYDAFHEVPYVRVRGGYGSGKTRFLLTVGSICYRPIFASAASTLSPLFRLIDSFRGTLILDEGDFRFSDEKSEIVKILNNGNARGFPVLRTEVSRQREFDPRAYHVFGPKVIATRGFFQDRALESRCLTEDMRGLKLRGEVPLNLDLEHRRRAEELRNKLLLYRFRNFQRARSLDRAGDRDLEPRLKQLFGPLLSVIGDSAARERLLLKLRKYNRDLAEERGESAEAQVLRIVKEMVARGPEERLAVQDIASEFSKRYGDEYGRRVTPRWIGSILRRRLGIETGRSTGMFTIGREELPKLKELYAHYGVDDKVDESTSSS